MKVQKAGIEICIPLQNRQRGRRHPFFSLHWIQAIAMFWSNGPPETLKFMHNPKNPTSDMMVSLRNNP
jgi:hypothetical protein